MFVLAVFFLSPHLLLFVQLNHSFAVNLQKYFVD